jgi:hypothetical protein
MLVIVNPPPAELDDVSGAKVLAEDEVLSKLELDWARGDVLAKWATIGTPTSTKTRTIAITATPLTSRPSRRYKRVSEGALIEFTSCLLRPQLLTW